MPKGTLPKLEAFLTLTIAASLAGCATGRQPSPEEGRVPASGPNASVIVFSDIHFDPLADPSLAQALMRAPASEWRRIFESAPSGSRLAGYGADSNYALLATALAAMHTAAPAAELVIFAGDLFPHKFEASFQHATGDSQHADFEAFASKTAQFVAEAVRESFPGALVLPALGNNDSPCGDYMSQPHSAFLQVFAQAWNQPLAESGNYSVLLPKSSFQGPVRAIVLNDVYWSRRYSDACGSPAEHPDTDELDWLQRELEEASRRGESVWIVGHIPAGLDLHASMAQQPDLCSSPDGLVPMLAPQRDAALLSILGDRSDRVRVVVTGHTHMNELRLSPDKSGGGVPWLMVPSISPIFANNPAFEVLQVSRSSGFVLDEQGFALDLPEARSAAPGARSAAWKKQYDLAQEYGAARIDGPAIGAAIQKLASDPAAQSRYQSHFTGGSSVPQSVFTDWAAYLCSMTRFDAAGFTACYCPKAAKQRQGR